MTNARVNQVSLAYAQSGQASARDSQVLASVAYGPPASESARAVQMAALIAQSAGDNNVSSQVSDVACLVAYATNPPTTSRQTAWTFVLDGHRFYVLPLGPEGDWAYDTTTGEWCQLQTLGYDGLNFTHGVMWGIRVIGGDASFPYLYELDPTQRFDEGWRSVERIVTGGLPSRSRSMIGVAYFTLTASVADVDSTDMPVSLAFSDDNGVTWSREFDIPLTDQGTQQLIWNALGSFGAPGRVFRITDTAGPVRLDGADCVLTTGSGADSGEGQD